MKRCFILLLMLLCLPGCGTAAESAEPTTELPEPVMAEDAAPVQSFTVVVENGCNEAIHGIGFEYQLDGTAMDSVLCTVQDGGWVEPGQPMEQVFDRELLGERSPTQFTARIFVVSAGSAQFCLSQPVELTLEDGGVYTYVLTGNEQEGYWLE